MVSSLLDIVMKGAVKKCVVYELYVPIGIGQSCE